MKVEMQSLDWEGITAAIRGQVTRQLSKEKEKSGADTFSKKSQSRVLLLAAAAAVKRKVLCHKNFCLLFHHRTALLR